MFIPPKKYLTQLAEEKNATIGKVYLKNTHLIIADEIANEIFENVNHVYISYKPDIKRLFIVPNSDEVFRKLHDPSQQMIKERTHQNEKSIALQEILIDNELANTDRNMEYEIRGNKKMLVIQF